MKSLKPDLLSFEITQETHFNIQQAEAEQFDSIRVCRPTIEGAQMRELAIGC